MATFDEFERERPEPRQSAASVPTASSRATTDVGPSFNDFTPGAGGRADPQRTQQFSNPLGSQPSRPTSPNTTGQRQVSQALNGSTPPSRSFIGPETRQQAVQRNVQESFSQNLTAPGRVLPTTPSTNARFGDPFGQPTSQRRATQPGSTNAITSLEGLSALRTQRPGQQRQVPPGFAIADSQRPQIPDNEGFGEFGGSFNQLTGEEIEQLGSLLSRAISGRPGEQPAATPARQADAEEAVDPQQRLRDLFAEVQGIAQQTEPPTTLEPPIGRQPSRTTTTGLYGRQVPYDEAERARRSF